MSMGRNRAAAERTVEPWADPDAAPFLRIRNVTKKFGDVYAVDNVSIDIYRKEFFALLGPSGCGKTTLLRMLAGFETPTSGTIEIDGVDMSAVPPWKRPVNMMFQSYALFPHMNVARNIGFGLRQDGVKAADIDRRVEDVLKLVRLQDFASRKPEALSGGQRQRVALARCIVKRPKLVLLDEPLGALDKKLREKTQFELVNIQESLGITFVIVTHDQEEAMTVSTRMAIMNEGRAAQIGTPSEVYEYPASRFIADFVGDVNMVEARVLEADERVMRLHAFDDSCEIVADRPVAAVAGEIVAVAIRPEKFELTMTPPPATDGVRVNAIEGQVDDIAYLGDVSIYHVLTRGGVTLRATIANRRRLIERPVTWNDRVWLTWSPDAVVVLKA